MSKKLSEPLIIIKKLLLLVRLATLIDDEARVANIINTVAVTGGTLFGIHDAFCFNIKCIQSSPPSLPDLFVAGP